LWDIEKLKVGKLNLSQEYIRMIKSKFEPNISEEAKSFLVGYFQYLRDAESRGKTTIRALESLLRLSQAHARMLYKFRFPI
jgi:DNA helicase MCM9